MILDHKSLKRSISKKNTFLFLESCSRSCSYYLQKVRHAPFFFNWKNAEQHAVKKSLLDLEAAKLRCEVVGSDRTKVRGCAHDS